MASPNKITEAVTLEGQPLTLAVDLNFYRRFHKLTGKDLLSGEGVGADFKPNPDDVVAMLYSAARSGKSDAVVKLTDDEGMDLIGGLVHPGNLSDAMDALSKVMKANAPSTNGTDPLAAAPPEGSPPIG